MEEYKDKLNQLEEGAKALGSTTSKSANDVADALNMIVKWGEEG